MLRSIALAARAITVGAVGAGLLTAGPAHAGSTAKHVVVASKVHLDKQRVSSLSQTGPAVSAQLGRGTMRAVSTVGKGYGNYRTTTTIRLPRGTLRLSGSTHAAPTADGETINVTGESRIVAGTGAYRGATGTFTVTGRGPVSLKWMTLTLSGALTR